MKTRLFFLIFAVSAMVAGSAAASESITATAALEPSSVRPGDSFELVVEAVVGRGYHVGSADKEALSPAELVVEAPKGIVLEKPKFPRGEWQSFRFTSDKIPVYEGEFSVRVLGRVSTNATPGSYAISATLTTQACKDDECYPPEDTALSAELRVVGGKSLEASTQGNQRVSDDEAAAAGLAGAGAVNRLLLIYLGGLLLAFTPCVYPMIPVTVGYFSAQGARSKGKVTSLASAYVLGIAVTYAIIGTVAATTGGALGNAMQSPAVLVGVAVVLVALALSMFGLYSLRAPAFIQDRASGRSGIPGALLMGLVFGAVAVPCAGPLTLGLAAFAARTGDPMTGFAMFFVLAMGLGTPLFLLAAFSARLPVPGRWMLTVERLGGFLLLGAAAYFILPVLPELVRPYAIPAVLIATGVYVGFVDEAAKSTKAAVFLARTFFAAAVAGAVFLAWPAAAKPSMEWREYASGAVNEAAQLGKPSIVDFYADWCLACKELDDGPWSDPRVIESAREFARFRFDGTRRTAAAKSVEKEFGIKGAYPTVLFFDSRGREVRRARVTGYVDSAEMIRRLRTVR